MKKKKERSNNSTPDFIISIRKVKKVEGKKAGRWFLKRKSNLVWTCEFALSMRSPTAPNKNQLNIQV
jgi:hypothetical protein